MSESIKVPDQLFRLILRFSNGETLQHIVSEPLDSRRIAADSRYVVITSVSIDNPSELSEIAMVNLRDISFIKTERVTVDQLATDRRMAGMRSSGPSSAEDKVVRALAQVSFI